MTVFFKIHEKFKSEGGVALVKAIYNHFVPRRLAFYSRSMEFFQSKAGLEIGGPSSVFKENGIVPVYSVASNIDNCTFAVNTIWEAQISEEYGFHFHNGKAPGRQYICEASNLDCIDPESYDFVLSSHCIEHLANPLQALAEWMRVIKDDGIIVLVIPHKDGTFDHQRPVTSLEHLIRDFYLKKAEDDLTHLEEILKLHDLDMDPEAGCFLDFKERSEKNIENRCLHHHVFDTRLAVEMVNFMNLQILTVEIFKPLHIIIFVRKLKRGQLPNNDIFRGVNTKPCWDSPFLTDQLA